MSEEPVRNKTVTDTIKKFESHPSIIKIMRFKNNREIFSFTAFKLHDVNREIDSLDAPKTIQHNGIPVKRIKANRDIFCKIIMDNFKKIIFSPLFLEIRKIAEVYISF